MDPCSLTPTQQKIQWQYSSVTQGLSHAEGEMTVVCDSDGQWTPNPGGITCSPRPTQTLTQTFTEASILTPSATPHPTGPGENQLQLHL